MFNYLSFNNNENNSINSIILIFDTWGGLCNQFYDIQAGINFCISYNIKFTFRYASFRNTDLTSWYSIKFNEFFNSSFLNNYDLYIDYNNIDSNETNTTNFIGEKRCIEVIGENCEEKIIEKINNFNTKYVVLKQFWAIYNFSNIKQNIYNKLLPSKKIFDTYLIIKNNLNLNNEPYNFLHYRHEHDFINHFQIANLPKLNELLVNNNFKNKNMKIYVATTSINNLINTVEYPFIIYKNESKLVNFNFEEKAFIDYMFGLHSEEVYGHSNSSFSHMLNDNKGTHNYYM